MQQEALGTRACTTWALVQQIKSFSRVNVQSTTQSRVDRRVLCLFTKPFLSRKASRVLGASPRCSCGGHFTHTHTHARIHGHTRTHVYMDRHVYFLSFSPPPLLPSPSPFPSLSPSPPLVSRALMLSLQHANYGS